MPASRRPRREDAIDQLAMLLPRRTEQFARVIARLAADDLPRGMASVLSALDAGPMRITKLAEREAVAQPTATRMVERLERQGLVQRRRDRQDGRIVVVSITEAGHAALEHRRSRYRGLMREQLAAMSDEELDGLRDAYAALGGLIDRLQPPA